MRPKEIHNKRIVIACLDWGMGHVTRSIGLIRELLEQKNEITVACDSKQKCLFESYFPDLSYENLKGYEFRFEGKGNWSLDLFRQRRSFLESIKAEHEKVKLLVKKYACDVVISDHRYGFHCPGVHSVFIVHQLHLPVSPFFFFVQRWHEKQIRKFDSVWVLDDEQHSLAGKLSQKIKHPDLNYCGWKSRFEEQTVSEKKYDYLIVVSGPKPYSLQFLEEMKRKIDFGAHKIAVIFPADLEVEPDGPDVSYFPATKLKESDELFYQCKTLVSRSGYSTLMDLKILKLPAILFPTPGQAEQLYLAKYLKGNEELEFPGIN